MTTLSIIIPCYNESESVDSLRETLLPVLSSLVGATTTDGGNITSVEIVLVDDGSQDDTFAALQRTFAEPAIPEVAVRLLQHGTNQGLGAALRTGFAAAQGDLIVTTDSDGTYRFESIPALIGLLVPDVDIVTASPYHKDGRIENVPAYRIFLSRGSSMLYRLLVDWNISCYTALFRAYRREIVKRIPFESDGFLAGTELMVNAMLAGYHVAEYPAVLYSRAYGASKAKIMRTIRAHLNFQWEVLLYRLGIGSWKPVQRMEGAGQ